MNATLRKMRAKDVDGLVAMYESFEPKGQFQGLPPRATFLIERWLHELSDKCATQFVIDADGSIVGHAMLCPANGRPEAELAIFVHQNYRGLGLGKKLLLGTLNYGCKPLQLNRVWLVTEGANTVALRLFESAGFRPMRGKQWWWWEMELERPSHCVECRKNGCLIYKQTLPVTVKVSRRNPPAQRRLIPK